MLPSGCPGCYRDGHDHEGKTCPDFGSPLVKQMLDEHEDKMDAIYQAARAEWLYYS